MSRRARVAAAIAIAGVLAAGGCGVPTQSDVVAEGRGEQAAPVRGDESTSEPDPRDATTDPQEFAHNFLMASAGAPAEAADRVRQFLTPVIREEWKPSPVVHVVRLAADPVVTERKEGGFIAEVTVTHLGELGPNGTVLPKPARSATYKFQFAEIEQQDGLFVTAPPAALLLPDTALALYFEQRTLYFWSADGSTLVPDLRYLPRRDVPTAQQPMQIIDWLFDGPSPWLERAVASLPVDARRVDNVPATTSNRLEVTLSKAVDTEDDAAVDRLATQLRWSLRPLSGVDQELVLRVDQVRKVYSGRDYLAANPAYRGSSGPMPLCVYDNEIRGLLPLPGNGAVTPELPAGYTAQVLKAALARHGEGTVVAVVRAGPGGRQSLDVGTGESVLLGVPTRTSLTAREIGQPVWLPGAAPAGLVVANGRLYVFHPGSTAVTELANGPRGVTAVAVPPDGRRLAYIAKGRLYVAPLLRDDNAVLLGDPHQVPSLLSALAGVGWSSQEWLVVAGRQAGRVQFYDLTVDGAVQEPRTGQFGNGTVTHLVAATDDAGDGRGAGQVMYEANGLAYELFNEQRRLTSADVAGVASGADPSAATKPISPFFLD